MENKIREAIINPLKEEGIILINVKYGEEDGEKTLFITIDSENGVNTDMCVKATKLINPILDNLDLEIEDYVLDVGSKGSEE